MAGTVMTAEEKRIARVKAIQTTLGVLDDGEWGSISQGALDRLLAKTPNQPRHVKASSFADPADVRRFRACKATGKTDMQCFAVGDNGVGKWGDDTTVNRPMVALPPEDWQHLKNPRGARVEVVANGRTVICELRDTMPRRANIKNGAGIDLNEAACRAIGLKPPIMTKATWKWAE